MKWFQKKLKDERVVAETNKIYKIGYWVLSGAIILDLYLQFANMAENGVRQVEFWGFLLAQIVCLVLMTRKGFADDNKYAESDVFPWKYHLLVSFGAGAAAGLALAVLMYFSNPYLDGMAMKEQLMIVGITGLSVLLLAGIAIFALNYLVFRVAKSRRKKLEKALEDE